MDDNHMYFDFIEYIYFYVVDVPLDLSNGIDGIFLKNYWLCKKKKCKLEVHSLSLIKKQCMTIMGGVRMNF
jgi:hypothetical protein